MLSQQLRALRLQVEILPLQGAQLIRGVATVTHRQPQQLDHLRAQRVIDAAQSGHAGVGVFFPALLLLRIGGSTLL